MRIACAENFGVPTETFSKIPLHNLYIFQGQLPASLAAVQKAMEKPRDLPPYPFTYSLGSSAPVKKTKGGEVRVADSNNFNVSKTIAVGHVTIRRGGLPLRQIAASLSGVSGVAHFPSNHPWRRHGDD